MQGEKELLERRLVLPLADPRLAEQFGVQVPRSIVLFGPPGTGKTTFAKAVASRLQRPFVEVFPSRLLICATNFIRALDDAFLRHGRFDYVIPIGLPDAAAREAIWSRYIPDSVESMVDLAQLVAGTDGYSPADIEFAARSASQSALEQSVFGAPDAGILGPSTDDYLSAIAKTRATVSSTVATQFREDIEALART